MTDPYKTLTPDLQYFTTGSNNSRIILIRTPTDTAELPAQIPGTNIIVLSPAANRQFANWYRATPNPRSKFTPPLSGRTSNRIKSFYNIRKYKLDD